MCAGNLQADEDLHRLAEKIAHDKANEKSIAPSNDYNENGYEIDTGDPSRVTGTSASLRLSPLSPSV